MLRRVIAGVAGPGTVNMLRNLKQAVLFAALASVLFGATAFAQATPAGANVDRGAAYYQYTLAHLYANQAAESANGGEYVNQAITAYKAAIAADPRSAVLAEELSDFYISFNRLTQARTEAEDAIRKNPNDIAAHRLLARIYVRQISAGQGQQIDANMLRLAIAEYQKVTDLDFKDVASLVFLGRLQSAAGNVDGASKAFEKALATDAENEDALVGMAAILADRGDNAGATEMFRRAALKNPSAASLQRLAAGYEQVKEYALAAETIRRALDMDPQNAADLRKALAQDLLNAGQLEEAVKAFEDVAKEAPDDFGAWLRISQIRMQQGDFTKAREAVTQAKQIDPENLDVRFAEISILQAEGKPREAIQALREVVDSTVRTAYSTQQRATRATLLERLAVMYRMLDQPEQAVTTYRDILTLDNTAGPRVSAEIIDTYRGGKKFDDAQKEAEAAVKKYPNDRGVRVARAMLDADLGRADAAAADVKKLLDGTDDRSVYLQLAEIYEKGKKFDDAGKALDAAEKISEGQDDKVGVWFMRGAMYEKAKNLPSAEREFRKVLNVIPDHTPTLNYLGYMLTDRNTRLSEALGMIQKAIAREPNNGAYLDSLGWIYYRMGRYTEAEEQIRRAVELSPGDPTMNDHYAEVLLQVKKVPEAVKAFEEALRQWQASAPAEKDSSEIDKVRNKLDNARKLLSR
ncbi:MAG: tetratricopeptide repeat protein [Acidobacteriota bacterium]